MDRRGFLGGAIGALVATVLSPLARLSKACARAKTDVQVSGITGCWIEVRDCGEGYALFDFNEDGTVRAVHLDGYFIVPMEKYRLVARHPDEPKRATVDVGDALYNAAFRIGAVS